MADYPNTPRGNLKRLLAKQAEAKQAKPKTKKKAKKKAG